MMKIDLLKLKEREFYRYDINTAWVNDLCDKISASETFEFSKEIKIDFSFEISSLDNNIFKINLFIKAPIRAECSHCLIPIEYNIEEKLCFNAENKNEPVEKNISLECFSEKDDILKENNIVYMNNYKLDLYNIVDESILLNVPYAFVCKEDCKGLCPKCGINKNHKNCDCENKTESFNNKFEKLKDLKSLED